MPGQITPDSAFGAVLKRLAKDKRYKVYVEVGTWDGQGSTRCLLEGLKSRKDQCGLISVEANREWLTKAVDYWQKESDVPLSLVYGRIAASMMTREEILAHPLFSRVEDHYHLHYEQDVKDFEAAPLIKIKLCDVAILDGGEFAGKGDWDALKYMQPKAVALDDIHVMKNSDVFKQLVDDGWKVIFQTDERNGSAILELPMMSEELLNEMLESRDAKFKS